MIISIVNHKGGTGKTTTTVNLGSATETNYIKGIIKSGARLIILIDIFKVIDQEMTNTLKKASTTALAA